MTAVGIITISWAFIVFCAWAWVGIAMLIEGDVMLEDDKRTLARIFIYAPVWPIWMTIKLISLIKFAGVGEDIKKVKDAAASVLPQKSSGDWQPPEKPVGSERKFYQWKPKGNETPW